MSSEKLTRAVGRRLVALPIGTQRAGSRIHTYRPARRISLLREPFKPVAGACNSMPKPTFSADRKEPHPKHKRRNMPKPFVFPCCLSIDVPDARRPAPTGGGMVASLCASPRLSVLCVKGLSELRPLSVHERRKLTV